MAKRAKSVSQFGRPEGWKPKKVSEADRQSSAKRGYGRRWRKERLDFLRDNPLCVECRKVGAYEAATVVDHIVPHRGNQELMWNRGNWQSLCKPHHDWKTLTEDVGSVGFRAVVCGPPGSGKTTFVESVRKPGDCVFDLDRIADVMFQMPKYPRPVAVAQVLTEMRAWLVDHLAQCSLPGSVYIIAAGKGDADQLAAQLKARVIDVERRKE